MCISDQALRAQFDGEMTVAESRELRKHLEACTDCQLRADYLTTKWRRLTDQFSVLDTAIAAEPYLALARFRTRYGSVGDNRSLVERFLSALRWPRWAVLGLFLTLALFGLAVPTAWADRFLSLFRVKQVTAISLDSNLFRFGDVRFEKRITQLLSSETTMIKDPGQPTVPADADEASALAGFRVRLPGSRSDSPQLKMEGELAFDMTIDRGRLQNILAEAGHPEVQLPASIDGAHIGIDIPPAVIALYGDWPKPGPSLTASKPVEWSKCIALAQVRSPGVNVPSGLDIPQLAEVGLQLTGMTPKEAHDFSQAVDWTSTLVIPVPQDAASFRNVDVDGVKGTLISQHAMEDTPIGNTPPGYTLLWVKNGVLYSLTGFGDPSEAMPLAESLR